MICPKCGFEQPESPECMRCGVIVGRYKGSAAGEPPPSSPPAMESAVFAPPAPGTVYEGPSPGVARVAAAPVLVITQKLRVGETLSDSFLIYFRNVIPFTILTAVAYSPIFLGAGLLNREVATGPSGTVVGDALVTLVTLLLCIPISTAAITYGVFQEMRGRETSLGSCLSVGLRSLLPVLSVAFLQILIVFGAVIATFVPGILVINGVAAGGTRSSVAWGVMLMLLLLAVGFVPAFLLWLKYYVAVPAAVEERPSAVEALRRSAFLTGGQRGRIFGILLVLIVLNLGVNLGAALVPGVGAVLAPLLSLVMTGLFATTCAVIYYRLRSFHESIDVDQIASVFA